MDIREIQGFLYFFFIVFITVILYGYIIHLYRSEKKGKRDYEKYSKLALDDEPTSSPLEPMEDNKQKEQ